MTTLNLKRKYTGIYEIGNEDIKITLSNPYRSNGFGTNKWQLVIVSMPDYNTILNEWFDTKKDASVFGAKWVKTN